MGRGEPKPLLAERVIQERVAELAREISRDHASGELLLVGVLRGAFIFLADLARRLTVPCHTDFVVLESYRGPATAPGPLRLVLDLREPVGGRHVLVVEDIVDTGHTLDRLLRELRAREPASLRTCVLLSKPSRRRVEVPIDYLGFTIPDVWVVGYGLDHGGLWRGLPWLATREPPAAPGAAGP